MKVSDLPQGDHPVRPRWRHVLPLPNDSLIATVNGPGLGNFYAVGEAYAHLVSRHLPERARILDVGCGCGKLTRFLYMIPTIESYVGFDVIPDSIRWNRGAFEHVGDLRFSFVYADVYSDTYNRRGKTKAVEYRFPAVDESVNLVVAASLFTHLLADEFLHYLDEVARVLCPGGRAVISIHDKPPAGVRFYGTRARVDIDSDHFVRVARKRGLELVDEVEFTQRVMILRRCSLTSDPRATT